MASNEIKSTAIAKDKDAGEPILEVDKINSYYGESHILHDVSITLDESSVLSILGRNGVGKTTLIRSITGIIIPKSGKIFFKGEDITEAPSYKRSRMGISLVPQGRQVIPNLTVNENLRIARNATQNKDWGMEEVFELFPRLKNRKKQYGYSLSGGEKQMLAIARALLQNTEILLLDEPFEGLAPQIIENIYDRLETITQEDISIIIIGQNIKQALQLSDYVYIMNNGRIVHESKVDNLLENREPIEQYLGVK